MIKVIKPGLWSTIQDMGRTNWRHIGVPLSGSMDQQSAVQANSILGNELKSPVLEITLIGPELEFEEESVVAICGADFKTTLNGIQVKNNARINIQTGDILSFGSAVDGARAYIAIKGGFQSVIILDSSSWYNGITPQIKLKGGEQLKVVESLSNAVYNEHLLPIDLDKKILSVHPGPEFEMMSDKQKQLLAQKFTIGVNDRMGYRLKEEIPNAFASMLSSPVLPGTVQLTPSGKMIILMRDCQTTGGYPRILQLTDESINLLAQKVTGDQIRFEMF